MTQSRHYSALMNPIPQHSKNSQSPVSRIAQSPTEQSEKRMVVVERMCVV